MKRELSTNGINLIKTFEGLRLKAYKPVSTEKYYTIGYGHYGADVSPNLTITETEAINLLKKDCEKAVNHVNRYMPTYNFNQNEFDALVSFAYNIGNINQLTSNGTRTKKTIADKMLEYNKSNGKVLKGLVTRRNKERELFLTPLASDEYYEIAKDVISGIYGNGAIRKQKITELGYDYSRVQAIVNKIMKGEL